MAICIVACVKKDASYHSTPLCFTLHCEFGINSPDWPEQVEWLEEDEVDVVCLNIPDGVPSSDSVVIESVDDWLAPVWTEDV